MYVRRIRRRRKHKKKHDKMKQKKKNKKKRTRATTETFVAGDHFKAAIISARPAAGSARTSKHCMTATGFNSPTYPSMIVL